MGRSRTSRTEHRAAVRAVGAGPLELLLPAGRRIAREPGPDAGDRRAVSGPAVFRQSPDGRTVWRGTRAGAAVDASDGDCGGLHHLSGPLKPLQPGPARLPGSSAGCSVSSGLAATQSFYTVALRRRDLGLAGDRFEDACADRLLISCRLFCRTALAAVRSSGSRRRMV